GKRTAMHDKGRAGERGGGDRRRRLSRRADLGGFPNLRRIWSEARIVPEKESSAGVKSFFLGCFVEFGAFFCTASPDDSFSLFPFFPMRAEVSFPEQLAWGPGPLFTTWSPELPFGNER
ncbi:hypothetical protein, partial [Rhodovulum sulfidophilum]|uniref:hypothetical protein n=1 Tax=Rhodovulum sulfidophilum TaxID=35806 RepID=UPI001F47800B